MKFVKRASVYFSRLIRELIRQFQLQMNTFIISNDNTVYLFNNIRQLQKDVTKMPNLFGFALSPEEEEISPDDLYSNLAYKVITVSQKILCQKIKAF